MVIRSIWTPNLCLMERRVNQNKVTDRRIGMYERAVTYEGPTHFSESMPINGTVLPAAVQTVCASMVDHFCEAGEQSTALPVCFHCLRLLRPCLPLQPVLHVDQDSAFLSCGLPVHQTSGSAVWCCT